MYRATRELAAPLSAPMFIQPSCSLTRSAAETQFPLTPYIDREPRRDIGRALESEFMTRFLVLTLVVFSCGTMAWGASSAEPEVLSVCTALKQIERLNGKIVTIRGVVGWVGHHGVRAMSQDGLDPYTQSCRGVDRRKRTWPPALDIRAPEDLEGQDAPAKFQEQPPTLNDLANTLREREEATGRDVAIATITGEVRTRSDIKIRRRGDDIIGNGYGQGGALPGMLIVKTVVSLEDSETRKSVPVPTSNPTPAK